MDLHLIITGAVIIIIVAIALLTAHLDEKAMKRRRKRLDPLDGMLSAREIANNNTEQLKALHSKLQQAKKGER